MERLWWIIAVAIYYAVYAYVSKLNNESHSTQMLVWTFIVGAACPFWIIVSRFSKNLLVDAFIYDVVLFVSSIITFAALGAGSQFTYCNWVGAGLILVGFILLRIP